MRLAVVVQVMVPHQDDCVLSPAPGFHDLADEHGVVTLGNLSDNPSFSPGRGIEQYRATGFLAGLELLSTDSVAFPFVGLEEVEGQVQLVFAQNVHCKDTGVSDVVVVGGVGLDSHRYQRRREGGLGDSVDGGRSHFLTLFGLGGQDDHAVGNHP
jgi:hypothetical protein